MKRSAKPPAELRRDRPLATSTARRVATRRRAPRGFTIAELLVALLVAAIVLVTISTSLNRIGYGRELAHARLAANQRAVDALEAIRRDLNSALRHDDLFLTRLAIAEGPGLSRHGAIERGELLLFTTRLNPVREIVYSGEGIEYETQYRIMDDSAGSALWRRRDPVPDDAPEGGGLAEPIADGVIGVAFEAYDGESWWTNWDSDDDGLPMAVRATVYASGVGPDEDPAESPELIVALRTIVAIDRVPPPRDEEAEQLARDAMAAAAGETGGDVAAGAGGAAAGAAGSAGAVGPGGVTVQVEGRDMGPRGADSRGEGGPSRVRPGQPRGIGGGRGGGGGSPGTGTTR